MTVGTIYNITVYDVMYDVIGTTYQQLILCKVQLCNDYQFD